MYLIISNVISILIMKSIYILAILTIVEYTLSVRSISEFRTNPLAISQEKGLFEVELNMPSNSRILAHAYFNTDSKYPTI